MANGGRKRWVWARRIALVCIALLLVQFVGTRAISGWQSVRVVFDESIVYRYPPAQTEFILLAYNIAHGRGADGPYWKDDLRNSEPLNQRTARHEKIAELIRQANADIVVLNEVDVSCFWSGHQNMAAFIAERVGYPYRMELRNYDAAFAWWRMRFGNAVLSRYPIIEAKPVHLPALSRWEQLAIGHKQGAYVTIALHENQRLHVLPIHFDHRSTTLGLASAKATIKQIEHLTGPIIMAGDFNSVHDDQASPPTAVTWLRDAGGFTFPTGADDPAQHTFPSPEPRKRIDWILTNPDVTVIFDDIISSTLSDHLPIRARFTLRGTSDASSP